MTCLIHCLPNTSWNSFPMNSFLSDKICGVAIPASISDSALAVSNEVLSLMKTMNGYYECRSIAVKAVPNSHIHRSTASLIIGLWGGSTPRFCRGRGCSILIQHGLQSLTSLSMFLHIVFQYTRSFKTFNILSYPRCSSSKCVFTSTVATRLLRTSRE